MLKYFFIIITYATLIFSAFLLALCSSEALFTQANKDNQGKKGKFYGSHRDK